MRTSLGLLSLATLCACGPKVGTFVDDGGSDGTQDASPPPEPDPSQPYPYCERSGGYARWCPATALGHGYLNWHVEGDSSSFCDNDDCNACVCYASCNGDASDCPQPDSGNAEPECLGSGTCMLTCGGETTCPDAMRCVHSLEFDRMVCAWVRDG